MRFFRPGSRRGPAENSVELVRLRRAMGEPRCPICRLVRESEEWRLWLLLYEHSGDPELHRRFERSLGLCSRHAEILKRIVIQRPSATPAAAARFYETLCAHVRGALGAGLLRQRCELCRYAEDTARRYAASLAELLRSAEGRRDYGRSDGLCIPHLAYALEAATGGIRDFLRTDAAARLAALEGNLRELQRKQRYDVHEGITPEEANAWREALWRFGGVEFDDLIAGIP
ncbi:MAG: hypothetical protein GXO72_01000 [Caldiserica bacterium]|nr:hypothetical protein [Caldisericota bacterium]